MKTFIKSLSLVLTLLSVSAYAGSPRNLYVGCNGNSVRCDHSIIIKNSSGYGKNGTVYYDLRGRNSDKYYGRIGLKISQCGSINWNASALANGEDGWIRFFGYNKPYQSFGSAKEERFCTSGNGANGLLLNTRAADWVCEESIC